ncbi:MAG: tRNA lysidine(34) synthetase TilS [Pseudooceanicola sp.]
MKDAAAPAGDPARLTDLLRATLSEAGVSGTVGVAVSGGGDSTALLHLLAGIAAERGLSVRAVTVDHGLRPEAAAEADAVARMCGALGVGHETLHWREWDGTGNLQDAARRARYRLITDWATRHVVRTVLLGHTADDQAETVLMRLARSAGVDGLAGIPARRDVSGITFLRPLLRTRRAELRAYLAGMDIRWVEDPTNDDTTFERVRVRQAMAALEPVGLSVAALTAVAENMDLARRALAETASRAARDCVTEDRGDLCIDRALFYDQPEEIRRRILVAGLNWISGSEYPPRRRPLADLMAGLASGEGGTLHGVQVLTGAGTLRLTREAQAVAGTRDAPGAAWDGRWRLTGDGAEGTEIRRLGEAGLALCPDWRETGMPRAALLASPAVWRGDDLVAAPLAGRAEGWRAELLRDAGEFHAAFSPH